MTVDYPDIINPNPERRSLRDYAAELQNMVMAKVDVAMSDLSMWQDMGELVSTMWSLSSHHHDSMMSTTTMCLAITIKGGVAIAGMCLAITMTGGVAISPPSELHHRPDSAELPSPCA